MKYVHYWHFYKRWYAEVNDNPNPEKVYWHNDGACQEMWNERWLIEGSEWMTHREIKKKLSEIYPNYILVKDKPYHQGARWNGYKKGSKRYD